MMSVNLVNCLVVIIWVNLHQREQSIDISIKPNRYSKDWNQSDHLFLTNPITFHNYFDENGFNSTLPGFHYEFKVVFFSLTSIFFTKLGWQACIF